MRLAALLLILPLAAQAQSFTLSEEDPPRTCAPGSIVASLGCSGDFCDNISLTCRPQPGRTARMFWTNWVESGGQALAACAEIDPDTDLLPPLDGFLSGIACRGDYCDDISLHCTRFVGLMIDEPNCVTTRHSDENRGVGVAPGFAIAAIRCSGRHCDNKDVTICPVVPQ
jgi:hypothetical protein